MEMAYISKRVSDLSGVEANDSEFVELVVREAPWIEQAVKLDVLPDEIKGLKSAGQLVILEIRAPGEEPKQMICSATEFKKLNPEIETIVKEAPGLRGRRPGFKPSQRG